MSNHVCNTATTKCTMGLGPSVLLVLPKHKCLTSKQPAANITDNIPIVNVVPFPMCNAPANPTVIAATAAALGVHTPAACLPVFPAPWTPGAVTVVLDGMPALDDVSQLMCAYAGTVSIAFAGQATETIP